MNKYLTIGFVLILIYLVVSKSSMVSSLVSTILNNAKQGITTLQGGN